MLDVKYIEILKIIKKEAPNGNFALTESDDILSSLPKRLHLDKISLKKTLNHLEHLDFINIKYDDDGLYCMAIMKLGEDAINNTNKNDRENPLKKNLYAVFCFLSAFLGAVLGCILMWLILK